MNNLLSNTYKVYKKSNVKNDALLYSASLGLSESQYIEFFKTENSKDIEQLLEEQNFINTCLELSEGFEMAINQEMENCINDKNHNDDIFLNAYLKKQSLKEAL